MQLSDKITNSEDLLQVEDYAIEHSAFMKECEVLFGLLSEDTFWKYREHLRTTYVYTPINIKGKPFHFVHLNKADPKLIAFTANDKIGKKDGKTFIKPGKYLAQYSNLDNEQIKVVVTNYKHEFVPPELFYATSADDAVRIYEDGPNSCMRGKGWKTENHPVRVYYGPDTTLAYIKNKTGKGISARSLIRTDRTPNEYIKIYGDGALMEKAFKAAGITQSHDGVKGCRFPLLWYTDEEQKKLLMPYIDGKCSTAFVSKERDNREYMIGGKPPEERKHLHYTLSTTPTSGFITMPDIRHCNKCGALEFEEKTVASPNGSGYCEACVEGKGLYVITIDEGYEGLEKRIIHANMESYSRSYFNINDLWYSRRGLQKINKFFNADTDEVIELSETEICISGDRRAKALLLVKHKASGEDGYFRRKDVTGLGGTYMHHDTFEFYTCSLAEKLIDEGATDISRVRDRMPRMLNEIKATLIVPGKRARIDDIINTMTGHAGKREFLRVYLSHYNNDSSYIYKNEDTSL